MLKKMPPMIGLLCLTACASTTPKPIVTSAVNPCDLLPLQNYSAADQNAVAAEVAAAPETAEWPQWVGDYVGLRDAVRACRKVK